MSRAGKAGAGLGASALLALAGFVAYHEGYVPQTYADPVGIPTVCFGHTGPDVQMGQTKTRAECEALLQDDLGRAWDAVHRCIKAPMQPHQAAALTSFTFNVGATALCKSTLARYANAGDWKRACAELKRWTWARGRQLPGLIKRREAEYQLCIGNGHAQS